MALGGGRIIEVLGIQWTGDVSRLITAEKQAGASLDRWDLCLTRP